VLHPAIRGSPSLWRGEEKGHEGEVQESGRPALNQTRPSLRRCAEGEGRGRPTSLTKQRMSRSPGAESVRLFPHRKKKLPTVPGQDPVSEERETGRRGPRAYTSQPAGKIPKRIDRMSRKKGKLRLGRSRKRRVLNISVEKSSVLSKYMRQDPLRIRKSPLPAKKAACPRKETTISPPTSQR